MTVYCAEYVDWDGCQEYYLFTTREAAQEFIELQTRNKHYWDVVEKEIYEEPGQLISDRA